MVTLAITQVQLLKHSVNDKYLIVKWKGGNYYRCRIYSMLSRHVRGQNEHFHTAYNTAHYRRWPTRFYYFDKSRVKLIKIPPVYSGLNRSAVICYLVLLSIPVPISRLLYKYSPHKVTL